MTARFSHLRRCFDALKGRQRLRQYVNDLVGRLVGQGRRQIFTKEARSSLVARQTHRRCILPVN